MAVLRGHTSPSPWIWMGIATGSNNEENNDGVIDAGENNPLGAAGRGGWTLGRGGADRVAGAPNVEGAHTFTRLQGDFPAFSFRRNGSGTEEGQLYITSGRSATSGASRRIQGGAVESCHRTGLLLQEMEQKDGARDVDGERSSRLHLVEIIVALLSSSSVAVLGMGASSATLVRRAMEAEMESLAQQRPLEDRVALVALEPTYSAIDGYIGRRAPCLDWRGPPGSRLWSMSGTTGTGGRMIDYREITVTVTGGPIRVRYSRFRDRGGRHEQGHPQFAHEAGRLGFTLIELLISIVVFGVIIAGAMGFLASQNDAFRRGTERMEAIQKPALCRRDAGVGPPGTLGTNLPGDQPSLVYAGERCGGLLGGLRLERPQRHLRRLLPFPEGPHRSGDGPHVAPGDTQLTYSWPRCPTRPRREPTVQRSC